MFGIVGWGAYVPQFRIRVDEIARVWGREPREITDGLGVSEKAVANYDEDTATISVEAARNALRRGQVNSKKIAAVFVGSESHPYVIKPTAATVVEAIGASPYLTAGDLEFACKAGTAGMQACLGMAKSGMVEYGMTIGTDTAQGRPGDALEYTAASGGAAFIVGAKPAAEIIDTCSYTTDTPDFWRREGAEYPSHGGRFTGEPAYFKHVVECTKQLLSKTGTSVKDIDQVIFHMPNAKFPSRAAKLLGIPPEKMERGLVVKSIGNTYSGSSLLGLARVLDQAKPGETILVTSFGSGAGSDSFLLKTTKEIAGLAERAPTTQSYIDRKKYLDYAVYAKIRRKIKHE
ncbi:hydroxymethylglutaryl-CoA synthase [Candidatus Micrarchaeota archaeon]|nr:hydroxymethylglutaryl-CoA synthase [Candidatus Micrarchaeota archaeon]